MPDPSPAKHLAGDADGSKPTGQGADGKTHNNGAGEPASARTNATDRAANAPRPAKPRLKTNAAGNAERTSASAPLAQPTSTDAPRTADTRRHNPASATPDALLADSEREPEKPNDTKLESEKEADMGRERGAGE